MLLVTTAHVVFLFVKLSKAFLQAREGTNQGTRVRGRGMG